MAKIDERAFRSYTDGQDRMTAAEYMRDREIVRQAVNDLEDRFANIEIIQGIDVDTVNEYIEERLSERIFEKTTSMEFINQTVNSTNNTAVYTSVLRAADPTPKKLYFRIFGTLNGSAGTKRVLARLGNAPVVSIFTGPDSGVFTGYGYVYFTGPDSQYVFLNCERHLGPSTRQSKAIGTNSTANDVTFTIEGQVENTADSIIFEMIEIGWA